MHTYIIKSIVDQCKISVFRKHVGDTEITVAVTPDGYADAVRSDRFVMPEERRMTLAEFLDKLYSKPLVEKESFGIYYIQKQNSNFHTEFSSLAGDVEEDISWATEAFGEYSLPICLI